MDGLQLQRLTLRGVPAVLILAALAEVIASFAAWGAATHVGIPAWETTFAGLAFGLPGVAVGVLVLRDVWRTTAGPFGVFYLQIAVGFVAMLIAIGGEIGLALTVADPSTYDSVRNEDGTFNTTPSGFVFIAVTMTIFVGFFLILVAYLYAQSITPYPRTSFDRREGEPDGVGELLRGKARPRRPWEEGW